MRRLIMLAAMSLAAVLVLAPAASAQGNPYCPEGGFPAAPQGAQQGGGGDLLCFPTQEAADTYNSTGEIPQVAGEVYNPTTGEVVNPQPAQEVANPDAVPCSQVLTEVQGVPNSATTAQIQKYGAERVQECRDQVEAQQGQQGSGDEATDDQYDDGGMQPPSTGGEMRELPDTGGPALLPLAGVMLVASGALGYAGLRRRRS